MYVASGGAFNYINAEGQAHVFFDGTHLEWIGTKANVYGQATVTLDGRAPVTADLYSSSPAYQASLYCTGLLADGEHFLVIEWAGTKHPSSSNYYISADAYDVMGIFVDL